MLEFAQIAIGEQAVVGLLLDVGATANAGFELAEMGVSDGDLGAEVANAAAVGAVWIAREVVRAWSRVNLGGRFAWKVGISVR